MRRTEIERTLSKALRELARGTEEAGAPDRVRRRLAGEVRSRRRPVGAWVRVAAAAAAMAAAGASLVVLVDRGPGRGGESVSNQPAVWAAPAAREDTLTPWFYHSGLPAPRGAQIIRIPVGAETAARFGVLTARRELEAEVLLGDDGQARAIRFMRDSVRQ
jgi:hypothetical protein